ncbi:MAG: SLC13 family permease, partial [Anaerolineales bacterium]
MTPQIITTLIILLLAVILFVSERLRVDLVALLVLGGLAISGLVSPEEALSGFSNPAVVTVWAVFVLSAGLSRTGVARLVGRQVMRLAGQGEVRLMTVIMLTAGVMSAFMNNVGVAAMLLPVVMDIARRTGRSPSKLLMPLAFGSLLGGMNTLIGTPPNILASNILSDFGLRPFGLFDYTPVGLVVTLAGIAFMALIGRRLLPDRDVRSGLRRGDPSELEQVFDMQERMCILCLPPNSALDGKNLEESRLGTALGINVIGIIRDGETELAPEPNTAMKSEDRLLVSGRLDRLTELRGRRHLIIENEKLAVEELAIGSVDFAEVGLSPNTSILGRTLQEIDFRKRFGVIVLAIRRDGDTMQIEIDNIPLKEGDVLLVEGDRRRLQALEGEDNFHLHEAEKAELYRLHEQLMAVRIPKESSLVGKSLEESRLAEAFGLTVLGIERQGETHMVPDPKEELRADDLLLVKGKEESLTAIRGLQDLSVEPEPAPKLERLESAEVGLVEAVLSPHTTLAGKTLRQLHFREKYDLSVLAIWSGGRAFRTDLRELRLRFGDALLLYGRREKLRLLGTDPDFLVLTEEIQEAPRVEKAPIAALVMAGVVLTVLLGWLPIAVAAVIGAALMVLTGCLSMDEAYRFIDWRAVFLIAGMLPLGIAMQNSGAARFLAEGVVSMVGGFGPLALVAGMFLLTALASQVMPNPVVTVLMAPIAISTAYNLDMSPFALMMVVALAASASFLSPVGHPANVLIMGPGGYRFGDY